MKTKALNIRFTNSPFDKEFLEALELLKKYAKEQGVTQKKVIGDAIICYANLITKGGKDEEKTCVETKE